MENIKYMCDNCGVIDPDSIREFRGTGATPVCPNCNSRITTTQITQETYILNPTLELAKYSDAELYGLIREACTIMEKRGQRRDLGG